jgi:hypothetical protein
MAGKGKKLKTNQEIGTVSRVEKEGAPQKATQFPDGVDGFDVRRVFLTLTAETTPTGFEWKQFDSMLMRMNFTLDKSASYQGFINKEDGGPSETMFIAHMDTVGSVPPKTVRHIIDGDIVRTNGETILGADDKAGMTVLLYLIHKRVPGMYVFTWGEEAGRKGSTLLASHYDLKRIKRAVAFDRKGKTSIITRQMASQSCSDEFADALIKEFGKYELTMEKDPRGSYTDTYSFTGEIPECTNISVGYGNAHNTNEYQDLAYLERLCYAAGRVDWESLPTVMDPKVRYAYPISYGTSYGHEYYESYGQEWVKRAGHWRQQETPEATEGTGKEAKRRKVNNGSELAKREETQKIPFKETENQNVQDEWQDLLLGEGLNVLKLDHVEAFVYAHPEAASVVLLHYITKFSHSAREHDFTKRKSVRARN